MPGLQLRLPLAWAVLPWVGVPGVRRELGKDLQGARVHSSPQHREELVAAPTPADRRHAGSPARTRRSGESRPGWASPKRQLPALGANLFTPRPWEAARPDVARKRVTSKR